MWMTSCTGSAQRWFGGFWKSRLVELLARKKKVDFRLLADARSVALWRVPHVLGGGRWKSNHWKIVHLSSLCRNLWQSEVIKGFVPELRSRYVFFVFRDSYVLCIYVMNILCTFHVSVSGYGTFIFLCLCQLLFSWKCDSPLWLHLTFPWGVTLSPWVYNDFLCPTLHLCTSTISGPHLLRSPNHNQNTKPDDDS